MSKSQSESPLRRAFSLVSLRGAEGDVAISWLDPKLQFPNSFVIWASSGRAF